MESQSELSHAGTCAWKSPAGVPCLAQCRSVLFYTWRPFEGGGNSGLREIWWKVSQDAFTLSQMVLNTWRKKTQIHFSQKDLILSSVWDCTIAGWMCWEVLKSSFKSMYPSIFIFHLAIHLLSIYVSFIL